MGAAWTTNDGGIIVLQTYRAFHRNKGNEFWEIMCDYPNIRQLKSFEDKGHKLGKFDLVIVLCCNDGSDAPRDKSKPRGGASFEREG